MTKVAPTTGRIGLSVHSLIERLSSALYARPHVAVRELLQNAHDATVFMRRKILEEEPGESSGYIPEVQVDFKQTDGYRCLTVRDNGIGMSDRDLQEELSVIGQTSKANDLEEVMRKRSGGDRVIGQYGIGFLAAFMVGRRIDVFTRQKGGKAWHWWCEGDEVYFIEELPDSKLEFAHGTEVAVRLKSPNALPPEFNEIDGLRKTAREYAALLQVRVWVRGQLMNRSASYWRTTSNFLEYPEKDMTEFLRERFPIEYLDVFKACETPEPDSPAPVVSYRGILFIGTTGPLEKALGYNISPGIDVYVRGMFVRRIAEMMPTYVNFVHGAVDFDYLNLDLSREDVRQEGDELFSLVQANLGRKVVERLQQLRGADKMRRIVQVHTGQLMMACLLQGDQKTIGNETFLDAMAEMLLFITTGGPLTLSAYLQQIKDASERYRTCNPNTIYIVEKQTSGAAETMLADEMGWPVVLATPIEQRVVAKYCDQHSEIKMKVMQPDDFFQKANDANAKEIDVTIRSLFEHQLHMMNIEHVGVRVKKFNKNLPALFLIESEEDSTLTDFFEQLERGARDQSDPKQAELLDRLLQKLGPRAVGGKQILYVNSDNPTIQNTLKLHRRKPSCQEVSLACRTVYNSAFLHSAHALSIENARALIANFNDTVALVLDLTLERSDETPPPAPPPPPVAPPVEVIALPPASEVLVSGIGSVTSEPYIFLIHPFNVTEVDAALSALREQAAKTLPGLDLRSAEDTVQAPTITDNVRTHICACRFAIADITGFNSNVMMEIGLVMSIGKPVLMILSADDGQKLPVNIGDVLHCKYDVLRGNNKAKIRVEFSEDIVRHLQRASADGDKFRARFNLPDKLGAQFPQ